MRELKKNRTKGRENERASAKPKFSLSVSLPCFVIAIFSFFNVLRVFFFSRLQILRVACSRSGLSSIFTRYSGQKQPFSYSLLKLCSTVKFFLKLFRCYFLFFPFLFCAFSILFSPFLSFFPSVHSYISIANGGEWFSIDCIFSSSRLSCINLQIIHFPIFALQRKENVVIFQVGAAFLVDAFLRFNKLEITEKLGSHFSCMLLFSFAFFSSFRAHFSFIFWLIKCSRRCNGIPWVVMRLPDKSKCVYEHWSIWVFVGVEIAKISSMSSESLSLFFWCTKFLIVFETSEIKIFNETTKFVCSFWNCFWRCYHDVKIEFARCICDYTR